MNSVRNAIIITSLIAIGGLFYACDSIIDVPAKGALSEDVLANEEGVETLLVGAYGALDGQSLNSERRGATDVSNWVYGSIAGGDAHKGESLGNTNGYVQIGNGNASATISYLDGKWTALYEGIRRANAVLDLINRVKDMSEADKQRVAAEARFLRGHYYFELKKMFNKVPWVDEETENPNQPNDQDIWPNIEADFDFAYQNLPEVQNDAARVNKWAAASYLAKTYVYQEKWGDAKPLFDEIIANGVTSQGVPYDLIDEFRQNYNPAREDGNPEAVFAVEMVANDGTGHTSNANLGMSPAFPYGDTSPFSCCGYFQPTQDLVNSYRTSSNGLPIIDVSDPDPYNSEMVTNDMGVSPQEQFQPYQGTLDPRLDWTVGRRGVPYHDWGPYPGTAWAREPENFGPYGPKKHVYWAEQQAQYADLNSWAPGSAINTYVIRFADVLLLAAETEIEVGSLEQARQYVNRVRERAANEDGWVSIDLNRGQAIAEVSSEQEMLSLEEVGQFDWVIREDTGTTFVFLGGGSSDNADNWQEYEIPNYNIGLYTAAQFSDPAFAEQAVHFERKLELAMEGHRFFDLVRWGEADKKLNEFFSYEGPALGIPTRDGQFTPGKNEYYPIPQNQIDLSTVGGEPVLQQNPGYN
ncbi:RagB/SusD family nutrient uptake outer membrane protein [Fodinibius sediminis]|uniref:Starch-binding associating with outer membrane n=1 Tax=Fodinibius sediminis TaxID=1214077 RepID=A0A521EA56_9BACT|nr:RagB/SusD family nutrient uptake outer membrane protein [Fodinibius sediminis]SMO80050.1 Starch-binding associating with outer membrane [Fodinibius sediminis]